MLNLAVSSGFAAELNSPGEQQMKDEGMSPRPTRGQYLQTLWLCFSLLILLICHSARTFAESGQIIAHSTPTYVSSAKNLGTEDPSKIIGVSIWLNLHDRAGLDALVRNLYNPDSANYRHWLKSSDIADRFAPTAAEARIVREFFESHNLKVVSVGPNNFYVRAQGTAADVESAFHVELNYYQVGSQVLRANASDPYVDGAAASFVQTVSGLDSGGFEHPLAVRSRGFPSSSNQANLSKAASAADSDFFQSVCFTGPKTENYNLPGTYPNATYAGNGYYSAGPGCGYSPSNLYGAYNLNSLYAEGYDGSGQTIVIVDWCGSPTIRKDADAFSKRFGLPALTASNFKIISYPSQSACAGPDLEINVDVEWAHAIAPGAKIDLVVPPTSDFDDVDAAMSYAINHDLGNVISGSYSSPEFFAPSTELDKENLISELAAASGIATNFASGDLGSYAVVHEPANVSVPADLPYATGVGGISMALNSDNSIAFETGWENYGSILTQGGEIFDPVHPLRFLGGAGGGKSNYFRKPAFQGGLKGIYRHVPDISWLADPYTGAVVLISEPTELPEQTWYAIGGTSLACPMFSALWAIANQEAGRPLGQAAPYLYSMPQGTITDIVPYSSSTNVTAVIHDSKSVTHRYNPAETLGVFGGLFGEFYSVILDNPDEENSSGVVSFGTDYDLKTAIGWDEVTGVGAPNNAQAFADAFNPSPPEK
jgi:subtilase family serine protease